jgi:hypothetical protein
MNIFTIRQISIRLRSTTIAGANAVFHMESLPSHRSIEVDFTKKGGRAKNF